MELLSRYSIIFVRDICHEYRLIETVFLADQLTSYNRLTSCEYATSVLRGRNNNKDLI